MTRLTDAMLKAAVYAVLCCPFQAATVCTMGAKKDDDSAVPGVSVARDDSIVEVAVRSGALPRSAATKMETPWLPAAPVPRRRCCMLDCVEPVATSLTLVTVRLIPAERPSNDVKAILMLVRMAPWFVTSVTFKKTPGRGAMLKEKRSKTSAVDVDDGVWLGVAERVEVAVDDAVDDIVPLADPDAVDVPVAELVAVALAVAVAVGVADAKQLPADGTHTAQTFWHVQAALLAAEIEPEGHGIHAPADE